MIDKHAVMDVTQVLSNKYAGEAANVAALLERGNSVEASKRLVADSQIAPHEMHAFLKLIKDDYNADRVKNPNLPEINVVDDKSGIKVSLKKDGALEAASIFERKTEDIAKVGDKPIPMTGELLGLTAEQTRKVLDTQAAEKAGGKGVHYFGDIVASLGFKTPAEINAALDRQDHLRAHQQAEDLSTSMPMLPGEGYFQMLERTNPLLSPENALQIAHVLKKLHHNDNVLKVGERISVLSEREKIKLEEAVYEAMHKKTGTVQASANQPLSEVPLH